MKKRISNIVLGVIVCCATYAQQTNISIQHILERDTTFVISNTKGQITKLSVNLSVTRKSPNFFARVVLEAQDHKNYLVGEVYKEIAAENETSLLSYSDETECLNGIIPYRLKIYVKDASVQLNTIELTNGTTTKGNNTDDYKLKKLQSKVDKINAYNNAHEKLWTAGITELSKMPFEDKMRALGFDESENTGGFEYYIGGIFEVGEREDYIQSPSRNDNYVDEFDWTNRHGKNWMTNIRMQDHSNYCVAFASLGAVEALVNLYYNSKIDMNLSEQEIACCCIQNSNWNPYKKGIPDSWAYNYLKTDGVCEEEAYPFVDDSTRIICMSDTAHPVINVKIADHSKVYQFPGNENDYEASIKRNLIKYGPLVSGFRVTTDSTNNNNNRLHAMTLVGYGTIHAGDSIREVIGNTLNSTYTSYYVIPENSPLDGHTYYKFKNSNNIRVNDDIDGYMYLMFHDMTNLSCLDIPVRIHYPFTITNCQTNLPMYTDNDIVCEDADGDGYYFWGLGPKPTTISGDPDGDDSDPNFGTMDVYGHLTSLTTDLYLYGNYVYDRDLNMHRNIIIPNGSVLRIKGNMTLCDNKQISVYGGGTLIIDGGTVNDAVINLDSNSTLNIQNNGIINMRQNQAFNAPVGAVVNISSGQVNNN